MNFKSFRKDILEEWNDVKGGWNDIKGEWNDARQDAKEEFVDIKREWMGMLGGRSQQSKNRIGRDHFNDDDNNNRFNVNANELEMRRQQIRNYEKIFQQRHCLPKLNQTIHDLLPSAKSLTDYYEARPELTQYTITKELQRINYTIYTHDHKKITDPSEILVYHKENAERNDLLWRCSNQSLLADVIAALTSPTGLIRPQMGAGTHVDDLSLEINFNSDDNKAPHVHAKCSLRVLIPDNNDDDRRGCLSLAGIQVSIYFCPCRQDLKVQVNNISPYPVLKEREIDRAAEFLAASCALSTLPEEGRARSPSFQQYFGKSIQWHTFNWNKI